MADVAARREARRRKILENSESRLQRISGQITQHNKTDNNEAKCYKSNLSSLLTNINTNGNLPTESLINSSWDDPMGIESELIDEDFQTNVINKRNLSNDNVITSNQEQNRCSNDNTTQHLQSPKQNISIENIDGKNELSILTKILFNQTIYIILAAIMNVMFILKLEDSFGKSIVVPFILIFSTRLWIMNQYNDNQRINSPNSMIIAALILCNVRPNVLYTFKKIYNIASQLKNDLAIFIFSFVIMYHIISHYWIDFDLSMANNKVEIIVDRHSTT